MGRGIVIIMLVIEDTDACNASLRKPKTVRNERYLGHIRTLPCCVCRRHDAEAHHVDTGGLGIKCNDTRSIPLCHACHTKCHSLGKLTFQERERVDFKVIQIECLERYILEFGI